MLQRLHIPPYSSAFSRLSAALLCGLLSSVLWAANAQPLHLDGRPLVSPSPLHLNDADFWLNPQRTRSEIERPLIRSNTEALLFDAPSVVMIDTQDRAPAQVLRVAKNSTARQWPFRESAVLVAVDLENNVVQAAAALAPPGRTVMALPPSSAPAQAGMSSQTFSLDLRERLALPWERGRMLVRLLLADQITPARLIEFKTVATHVDPAAEAFKAEQRLKTRVPLLLPEPGPWVSYVRDDAMPILAEGQGLALKAQRLCVQDGDAPCLLRGSFRLPVLKRHIVPPGTSAGTGTSGAAEMRAQWIAAHADAGRSASSNAAQRPPMPTAVVPITLVAQGSQDKALMIWRLVLPVFESLDFSGERPMGGGHFALDLRSLEGFGAQEQSWFISGFSDHAVSGPLTVAVTRRPRTP